MMKKELNILIISFLVLSNLLGLNLIGRFYSNDPIRRGQEYELLVTARNPLSEEMEDVMAKLYIYDLGIRVQSRDTDIDDGDSALFRINWDVPNIPRGLYLTKLTVGNDFHRDSNHMLLRVI